MIIISFAMITWWFEVGSLAGNDDCISECFKGDPRYDSSLADLIVTNCRANGWMNELLNEL